MKITMKNKQIIFGLLFNGLIAQSGSNQIVVEETMFMDAPYVGEITTTNIKYAADGLYREETQMEVGSFFIRMAMGGNQKYGSILDGKKELRTIYNLKEEEYAQENFEGIRNNDGTPTLKGMENSFGRGGGNSNQNSNDSEEDESNDNGGEDESNENNEDNAGFERTISDNFEKIAGFKAKKVTTKMMGNQGPVLIEEWFTIDTTLFQYVSDMKTELVVSYGGKNQQSPRSFSEMMLKNQGHEFESVDGRMIKYKMERKDDDDDDGFTMQWQIKSAKKMPFNRSDFEIPKDHKKVDKLD